MPLSKCGGMEIFMKYCIAVTEILRRTIIVKTKDAGVDSLEKAIDCVRDAHNA